jgi:ribonuclease VapC
MVIDSSVLIAILQNEPDAPDFASAIADSDIRLLSAANLVEASIVIERRNGDDGARDLDLLLYRTGIEIVSVDAEQAEAARVAWRRFGKSRHPAGLNFGDCFAYALAKVTGLPLLYKGSDFALTDL